MGKYEGYLSASMRNVTLVFPGDCPSDLHFSRMKAPEVALPAQARFALRKVQDMLATAQHDISKDKQILVYTEPDAPVFYNGSSRLDDVRAGAPDRLLYPVEDWKQAVVCGQTTSGYAEWVDSQKADGEKATL